MKRGEPSRRPRPAFLTVTLLFASGIVANSPGTAQNVLETRPGAVRIWDSSAQSVDLVVGEGRVARAGVAAEGGYVVAGEDPASGDLFFVFQAGSGAGEELPVPPKTGARQRARPVLLTRHDRLDGAVWLEGSSSGGLAVVAAAWNGTSWERLETVAAANGRPQLAPAAAVLADGTWLAVWAGYDGEDDEIFWSRRRDGVWSPPRRVHRDNRVPDLLPSLIADGDGVLAAWSFYDGNDYRVRTAGFRDGGWHVEAPLDGRGAGNVGWQKSGGRSFVVYRSIVPEAWTAVELAPDGGAVHRVRVETADERPPLVQAESGLGPPRLTWPYGRMRPRR